ncbi:putative G-protein coupled receptor 34b [Genypterus blacodes]|uniref:putative G-protein coupled receptor 34b n=1 Tax=Genypterus blacodes TaxID=154954 RepID=UPI003F76B487
MTEDVTTTTTSQFANSSAHFLTTKTSWVNVSVTSDLRQNCTLDDSSLQLPLAILYSLLFVLGLIGNLLALWVFFCVQSKKNSIRVFLINTAFADLLLVVCLPFRILYHSQGNIWELHPTLCKVVGNLFYMNMYISITLLGLISVDRNLKIHRGAGMQRKLHTTRWSSIICAAVWFAAFATILMFLMSENHSETNRCFHYKQLHNVKWKAYINLSIVVVFWIVFVSLAVSYWRIAHKLLRTSRQKPDLPNAARYTRTAWKSFFILFLFTICFVPYHVVRVFYIKSQITDTSCFWRGVADKANEVALLFSALNSCLDPVLYFLLSSSVRKEVLRLLSNVLHVRDSGVNGSSSSVELRMEPVRGKPSVSFVSTSREKMDIRPRLSGTGQVQ